VIRDGWLHTGDIGTTDADGRLRVVDRLKDLILVGGFNVHPAEVEHVLVEHPTVREAAVVGVRDDRLGEVPVAHVVPDGPIDEEDVLAFCRARLSSYKVPRRIVECEELPRNSAGKVLKRSLQR
jgi:HIP---CoA ligase